MRVSIATVNSDVLLADIQFIEQCDFHLQPDDVDTGNLLCDSMFNLTRVFISMK